jgi:hypothetical protein
MKHMNEAYYVRWKAQVSGPFPSEDIKSMLLTGRITKHHQVSVDRVTWTPLQESEDFCAECRTRPVTTSTMSSTVVSDVPQDHTNRQRLRVKPTDDQLLETRWYYVENGQSTGPLTMWELRQLVDAKEILKDCPVCKEGEERWVKAGIAFPSLWNTEAKHQSPLAQLNQRDSATQHMRTSAASIWSLVLGILSLLGLGVITGIPAIICGHTSRTRIRCSSGSLSGAGMSLAGLIMGYIGTFLCIVGLLAAIAIPSFMKARTTSQKNACINNLRQIEAAKEQWALENKLSTGADVITIDVNAYMKTTPVCPVGGLYTYDVIGSDASCSVQGHVLQ